VGLHFIYPVWRTLVVCQNNIRAIPLKRMGWENQQTVCFCSVRNATWSKLHFPNVITQILLQLESLETCWQVKLLFFLRSYPNHSCIVNTFWVIKIFSVVLYVTKNRAPALGLICCHLIYIKKLHRGFFQMLMCHGKNSWEYTYGLLA